MNREAKHVQRTAALDHLVVMASTLQQGVAWCEAVLGTTPGPGGVHPLMGTHNRLLPIGSPQWPDAFLEVISIDPGAVPERHPARQRWFDMDSEALQARVARDGPQLTHWVAQVPDIATALRDWISLKLDPGPAIAASRMTAKGLLQWQISVRDDGQRLFDGCLPTLIQWGGPHPMAGQFGSAVRLQSVELTHPDAATLSGALDTIGIAHASVDSGAVALSATLHTPLGLVTLGRKRAG